MFESDSDLLYVVYVLSVFCVMGLVYICIIIIAIAVITSKHNVKEVQREVDISMEYMDDIRIYEKKEKVIINKENTEEKGREETYHSYKRFDKTIPKLNLLFDRIVEIDGKKEYSDKQSIENNINIGYSSDTEYTTEKYEKVTKIQKFDSNGKMINELNTIETMAPIDLIEPSNQTIVKSKFISTKIPVSIERNRIKVRFEGSSIETKSKINEKTALDVISYSNTSVPALSVSSEANETTIFMADTKPVVTSDALISNLDFRDIKALVNNIDIQEIPVIGSHLKIKEVPVFISQIEIDEKRGPAEESNSVATEVIEAKVPVLIECFRTKRKIPALIPVSIQKTKILKDF